ncbi:molybdate ABC transporter substrate-binding protein [Stagnihabitans tardus]|uniref:Molybdate-binding protein ModA n=1 Tax=Stagnihabitans tardus TaxID=2699202 RepID=A0AAE4YE10_9RHOB|nr:molybdate ABC transporter substrate-binding protein [Stagnihabitans tardus]NBZ87930.1 molybdate ABC transporter substrate-binding protein [Stagnihabitans tardus]
MRHFLLAGLLSLASPIQAAEITVFAAASLKGPLDAVAEAWQAATGNGVTISYGGSSALAKQIEQGAPADVFLSAAESWMDKLAEDKLIQEPTRRDFFGNALVLIAADPAAAPVTLDDKTDLNALLAGGKLAMALVDSVPAGQYGREALTALGLWEGVAPNVAQAQDVKATLTLVTSGEAPYGIVYATDAKGAGLTPVAIFPKTSHKPILYPGAATVTAKPEAAAFLDFLATPEAGQVFAEAGFAVLP